MSRGQIRIPPSGGFIAGENDGDTLVWNAALQLWESGPATGLEPGTIDLEPLVWNAGLQQWVPSTVVNVSAIGETSSGGGIALASDGVISATGDVLLGSPTAGNEAIRVRQVAAVNQISFFGETPVPQPTVTGAKGGNVALASLIAELVALGLIVDGTS